MRASEQSTWGQPVSRGRQSRQSASGLHKNLVMVQTSSAEQLAQLIKPASVSNRVVRRLDERTILVSRAGMAAVRKRIVDLGLGEQIARHGRDHA
jgi:hypothetical protein